SPVTNTILEDRVCLQHTRSPIHRAITASTDPAQTVRVGTPIPSVSPSAAWFCRGCPVLLFERSEFRTGRQKQAQRGQPEGPRQRGAFLCLLSCCITRKKVARRGEIPAGRGMNPALRSALRQPQSPADLDGRTVL